MYDNIDKFIKNIWVDLESKNHRPEVFNKVINYDHHEFVSKILEFNKKFIQDTCESIFHGDLYFLKNAIKNNEVSYIIDEVYKFNKDNESTFYKMKEKVPNFHRWIDSNSTAGYSIKHVKHSTFLFHWNKDIGNVNKIICNVCRPLKLLSGLSFFEYEKNTPKDLIIERTQVVRYPPGGYIEPHLDNNRLIRFIISGYLSTKGIDYDDGGFYVISSDNKKLELEQFIKSGDVGVFFASLRHGLDTIDKNKEAIKGQKDGRWWFGYNIHNSDEIKEKDRVVANPYDIKNSKSSLSRNLPS